jgi:hypothetical protein
MKNRDFKSIFDIAGLLTTHLEIWIYIIWLKKITTAKKDLKMTVRRQAAQVT